MVEFHLPFATTTETVYRTISMYVMAQFFCRRRGKEPDLDLVRLPDLLEDVRQVDLGFCGRISALGAEDASRAVCEGGWRGACFTHDAQPAPRGVRP